MVEGADFLETNSSSSSPWPTDMDMEFVVVECVIFGGGGGGEVKRSKFPFPARAFTITVGEGGFRGRHHERVAVVGAKVNNFARGNEVHVFLFAAECTNWQTATN